MKPIYIIIAHLKNGDKKYFNEDKNSGGYGYLSDDPELSNRQFYNFWNERVGKDSSYLKIYLV